MIKYSYTATAFYCAFYNLIGGNLFFDIAIIRIQIEKVIPYIFEFFIGYIIAKNFTVYLPDFDIFSESDTAVLIFSRFVESETLSTVEGLGNVKIGIIIYYHHSLFRIDGYGDYDLHPVIVFIFRIISTKPRLFDDVVGLFDSICVYLIVKGIFDIAS